MKIRDDPLLLHGRVYDPRKAREYYLRTRHLKGRSAASRDGPGGGSGGPKSIEVKRPHSSSNDSVSAQKAALEKRLSRLKDVLAGLVEAAKARSGVDTPSKTTSTDKKTADTKDTEKTKQTTKQKKDAAAKAHDNYVKTHPDSSQSKDLDSLTKQIKDIRAKIQAAIEDARQKSTSQTATEGR